MRSTRSSVRPGALHRRDRVVKRRRARCWQRSRRFRRAVRRSPLRTRRENVPASCDPTAARRRTDRPTEQVKDCQTRTRNVTAIRARAEGRIRIAGAAGPTSLHIRRKQKYTSSAVRRMLRTCASVAAVDARRRRQAIGSAPISVRPSRSIARRSDPRRGRDDGWRLSPSMPARRAEKCGQHDTAVCDEHLARHAARAGMMDSQAVSRDPMRRRSWSIVLGHAASLSTLRRRSGAGRSPMTRQYGEIAAHLDLQDTAVLESQLENFAILCNSAVTPVRQSFLACSESRHGFRIASRPKSRCPDRRWPVPHP